MSFGFRHFTKHLFEVVEHEFAGAAISLLAINVGLSLTVLNAIWMAILVQLAASIPITPIGIGLAEASLVLLFVVNGFPGALGLSVAVVARVIFLLVIAAIYISMTLPLMAERLRGGNEAEFG